jgi:hypothetical protein
MFCVYGIFSRSAYLLAAMFTTIVFLWYAGAIFYDATHSSGKLTASSAVVFDLDPLLHKLTCFFHFARLEPDQPPGDNARCKNNVCTLSKDAGAAGFDDDESPPQCVDRGKAIGFAYLLQGLISATVWFFFSRQTNFDDLFFAADADENNPDGSNR